MELSSATAVLSGTPIILDTILTGVDDAGLHRNDGPDTWSAYDIVGHLLLAETTDWIPRARMILEHGVDRVFEPFDREAMRAAAPAPIDLLLERFRTARLASLAELSTMELSDADLARRGRHPELGEVTLAQLLSTWVAHDLTHLGQLSEVLARTYREDVGPWRAYLPALDRVAPAE